MSGKLIVMMQRRVDRIKAKISMWQNAGAALVHGGGLEAASFVKNAAIGPDAGNNYITVFNNSIGMRIRQEGFVYGAKVRFCSGTSAGQLLLFLRYDAALFGLGANRAIIGEGFYEW